MDTENRKRSATEEEEPGAKRSKQENKDAGSRDQILVRVLTETKWVGGIIGKAGSAIKQLRTDTGAHITVSSATPTIYKRIITVKGDVDVAANALHIIADKLCEARVSEYLDSSDVSICLLVPNVQIGGVIGKGGSRISETRENSGASIRVSEKMMDNSTEKTIQVTGSSEQVYKALILICYQILENSDKEARQLYVPRDETTNLYDPQFLAVAPTPYAPDPYAPLPRVSNPYAHPLVPPHPTHPTHPPHDFNPHGHFAALSPLSPPFQPPHHPRPLPTPPSNVGPQEKVVIPIPETLIGYIIGRSGCIVKDIRSRSGANIKISDKLHNATERTITIMGSQSANEIAVSLINEKLSQYQDPPLTSV